MALNSQGTGADKFARGSTGQRPATPQGCDIRYNTSLHRIEYWDGGNNRWSSFAMESEVGNGQIKLTTGTGLTGGTTSINANSGSSVTHTVSFDTAWGDGRYPRGSDGPRVGIAAAWSMNGPSSISLRESFNVASITSGGGGVITINYRFALNTSNYSVHLGMGDKTQRAELMFKINSLGGATSSFGNPPTRKDTTGIDLAWGGASSPSSSGGPPAGEKTPYLSFCALES